jgi:hypothetical protein
MSREQEQQYSLNWDAWSQADDQRTLSENVSGACHADANAGYTELMYNAVPREFVAA